MGMFLIIFYLLAVLIGIIYVFCICVGGQNVDVGRYFYLQDGVDLYLDRGASSLLVLVVNLHC